jgi:DNA-3-methyladenine glycosylase II
LQALGLSGAKARCFLAAAAAQLDFDLLHRQSDEQIMAELTRISGIGPWTADIYLLTAAGRSDAWPTGDLALQIAAADLFNLPGRPDLKCMTALAAPWRPYRSAAARLLWSHYRFLKGMPQQVI